MGKQYFPPISNMEHLRFWVKTAEKLPRNESDKQVRLNLRVPNITMGVPKLPNKKMDFQQVIMMICMNVINVINVILCTPGFTEISIVPLIERPN